MPNLSFQIEGAEAAKRSATPEIVFKLQITNSIPSETIHSVALRGQVQLEVTRRPYSTMDQGRLHDLFSDPTRWSKTLRNFLWTHINLNVPAFQGSTLASLPVQCTFDFNVAATKYFYGLEDGDVPLCLMFSGTVFYYTQGDGHMMVAPIPWDKEARFNLPVKVWREMMDIYYPNSAWLCLRRDVFERLYEYKTKHGIPTWEQALETILRAEEMVRE